MTLVDDLEVSDGAYLPVRYEPPAPSSRPYQPRHALEPVARPDRTTMWLFLVLILTSGFVAGTTAAFRASTTDTGNLFGAATLSNPSGQTIAVAGNNLDLSIATLGAFDGTPAVAYGSRWRSLWPTGVSTTGSAPSCTSDSSMYTNDLTDSTSTAKTTAYTSVPGFADGRWLCIMGHTAYPQAKPAAPAEQWYSQRDNPRDSVQLGHVVQSVTLQDASSSPSSMKQNDQLVITFNQAVDATSRPTGGLVCARANPVNRIFVGSANASGVDLANCNNNNPGSVKVLYLKPVNATIGGPGSFTDTTWAWSGDGRTLTITLNNNQTAGIVCTTTPCFRVAMDKTYSPSTTLESATGARALCVATDDNDFDNGICEPNAVGSF